MSDSSFLSSILLSPESKRKRFSEPAKFVPVLFVFSIITSIYMTWVFGHCVPMLQPWTPAADRDHALRRVGLAQLCVFHCLTGMLLFCYGRSMLCHPGEIPDDDVQWNYIPQDARREPEAGGSGLAMSMQETKKSGDRRHCKWCSKYKPDRCHHCRACRTCVLRMDHHCPWIYNCVGYRNYKYFFLLLFYCVLDLHFIFWSMLPTIKMCFFEPDLLFVVMFGLLFCATLSAFLGCLVTLFWCFHVWLMLKAMTTIEFCEKSLPKNGQKGKPSYETSVYNLGCMANITTVLGDNPLLWLLPMAPPSGDGLNYVSDQTRLTTDMDAMKGIRRKGHQRVQRYGAAAAPPDVGPVAS